MLIPCGICLAFMSVMIHSLIRRWPIPSGAPCVVVNIIRPTKRVDSPLPSGREGAILILGSVEVVLGATVGRACLARGNNARYR
jgi:hypothetical protein